MKRSILILILTVSLLLAACTSSQTNPKVAAQAPTNTEIPAKNSTTSASTASLTQVDGQGAVTVEVTPINLDQPGDTLQFDVAMNTHSVDLSMDLKTLATLTTDTGLTVQATDWDAPGGGHHVSGKLSFPATQSGKPILDGAKQLTLTITGIDNATRTFTWDLNAK